MPYNSNQVSQTLELLLGILHKHNLEYRLFGSLIPAAIQGKLHRNLNDIDMLLDIDAAELFGQELQKHGYIKKDHGIWGMMEKMHVYTYSHKELLEVGFFAVVIKDTYSELTAGALRFQIQHTAIKKTAYSLLGHSFLGIPADTQYARVSGSRSNPKRQREFGIYKKAGISPRKPGYIRAYLFGVRIDWVLLTFSGVLDVLGRIRVALGLSYDPWR